MLTGCQHKMRICSHFVNFVLFTDCERCHICTRKMQYKMTNRLAERLAAKGVKKSQLAFWLKMSRAYVTRLERGSIRPSIQTALRIASYFKKPVEEIFQLVEDDTKQGNFPSVPGSGQEHQITPETTNKRK